VSDTDDALSVGAAYTRHSPTSVPLRIGPYQVLRVLGEGGMGIVFEALETGAVRRRVAVKVIRGETASREILARFEAERQALALMDHPGIARVLSAGETEDGTPWFAMELVRGLPITEYCDAHRLSTRDRLQLFSEVCRAVQHAHQKGVIHRDLKPSNVLVTVVDGRPVPKVIDFGIAKATGGTRLTEQPQRLRRCGGPRHDRAGRSRGARLDRDAVPGKGPHPPLRNGQRAGGGPGALPAQRAGARGAAVEGVSVA
jgi:serine/threonine protein kinase